MAGPRLPPGASFLPTAPRSARGSSSTRPSGKALAVPANVFDQPPEPGSFAPPPGIGASWTVFTDALGTHFPKRMSRTLELGRRLHDAIR